MSTVRFDDDLRFDVVESLPTYSSEQDGMLADEDSKKEIVSFSCVEKSPADALAQNEQLFKWLQKAFYIAVNISSSVGIIFYNKHALSDPVLRSMPLTTVAVHSFCTAGVMAIAARKPINLFEPTSTPVKSLLSLALAFPMYVVLGLLSVANNPVSIYQLGKVMNSPIVALFNFSLFRTTVSKPIILSIILMCAGVIATIRGGWDTTTPLGLSLVVSSTCAAAMYQIGIGFKHKELKLTSPQLCHQQSRLSALLILPMIPFVDVLVNPLTLPWSAVSGLIGTGIVASVVNLSQFLVIESTSALTFNVAGQLKTVLVIIIAWITAERPPSTLDYIGVAMAMTGSAAYAFVSLSERQRATLAQSKA